MKLGALLFIDQAWRNWYFGANAEFKSVVVGPTETEDEFALGMSYSFIQGTGNGIAAPRPRQSFVPVLSLEIISAQISRRLEKENNFLAILPDMHLKLKNRFNWDSFFK